MPGSTIPEFESHPAAKNSAILFYLRTALFFAGLIMPSFGPDG